MKKRFPNECVAADVMSSHVLRLSPGATLKDAMEYLVDNHVSGVPVVNHDEICVGVVSASDILGYEQDRAGESAEANEPVAQFFDEEEQEWETVRYSAFALEHFAHVPVQDVMSGDPVAVRPETPIKDVARIMTDKRIHRVLVTKPDHVLVGIVTSMDIAKAVAKA